MRVGITVRRVLLEVGIFKLYTFGVFMALGMIAAILVAYSEAKRKKIDPDKFLEFSLCALILGLVGARVAYVLTSDPTYFAAHPLEVLRVDLGGLSVHGAIFGGTAAGIWFSRRQKISFWRLADAVAPGLILGQAIGRIGCDVFGYPMARPAFWGVYVGGLILHPTQVYEFLLDYLIFAFLWSHRNRTKYEGQLFVEYLFLFSMARGVVEFFRINPMVWGPFSIAHVASLLLVLTAVASHLWLSRLPAQSPAANFDSRDWPIWLTGLVAAAMIVASIALYYGFPPP